MAFELPKLSYAYAALELFVNTETMDLRHTKHKQKYLDPHAYINSVRRCGTVETLASRQER